MELFIIFLTIIGAFSNSLSDIFQNNAIIGLGPLTTGLLSRTFCVLAFSLLLLYLLYSKKPLGPIFIPKNFTKTGIFYSIIVGILTSIVTLLLGTSFYYNDKLKNPINIGILMAIISINFVFTIIINEIRNFINKKPSTFSKKQGLGVTLITIAVLILSFFK